MPNDKEAIRKAALELQQKAVEETKIERFTLDGRSMLPLFRREDSIITERIDSASLCSGDVIVFKEGSNLVAHRILWHKKETSSFKVKGDNRQTADDDVSRDEVVSRIIAIVREGKEFNLRSPIQKLAGRFFAFLSTLELIGLNSFSKLYRKCFSFLPISESGLSFLLRAFRTPRYFIAFIWSKLVFR